MLEPNFRNINVNYNMNKLDNYSSKSKGEALEALGVFSMVDHENIILIFPSFASLLKYYGHKNYTKLY